IEDIRECIGCNICIMSDNTCTPIRCTQNPTMGEEWRKGWHPEIIAPAKSRETVLVVGGGPAGLEASRALAARGLEVMLAERREVWGGRVTDEAGLPGLSAWGRVRDWRLGQLDKMPNASLFPASDMTAENIAETGAQHVVLATGSTWRADGVGRSSHKAIENIDAGELRTPDDLMAGRMPDGGGPVVIYDDDGIYMGGLLAHLCARAGLETVIVTPYAVVSPWSEYTLEQHRIQKQLLQLGVRIMAHKKITARSASTVEAECVFTGQRSQIDCHSLVPVTARLPECALWEDLQAIAAGKISTITRIGDCLAPGAIVHAVYAGHRYAREFGATPERDRAAFRREA
ncbi:MAG TPA: FAD-dependent oxidoreductase, partial [Rhizobiales bacterium]|nr:FAD-dependent oxidoreductase [Hyphomicrobiales bacterium]